VSVAQQNEEFEKLFAAHRDVLLQAWNHQVKAMEYLECAATLHACGNPEGGLATENMGLFWLREAQRLCQIFKPWVRQGVNIGIELAHPERLRHKTIYTDGSCEHKGFREGVCKVCKHKRRKCYKRMNLNSIWGFLDRFKRRHNL
jgi:hypothetical protein